MAKLYTVQLTYTVEVTVNDQDAVDRQLTEEWQGTYYDTRGEVGAVSRLARLVGVDGNYIGMLDGWADLPNDAVLARVLDVQTEPTMAVEDV